MSRLTKTDKKILAYNHVLGKHAEQVGEVHSSILKLGYRVYNALAKKEIKFMQMVEEYDMCHSTTHETIPCVVVDDVEYYSDKPGFSLTWTKEVPKRAQNAIDKIKALKVHAEKLEDQQDKEIKILIKRLAKVRTHKQLEEFKWD